MVSIFFEVSGNSGSITANFEKDWDYFSQHKTSKPDQSLSSNIFGDDLASTRVTKPEGHVEDVNYLVKPICKILVANDDNYALAA